MRLVLLLLLFTGFIQGCTKCNCPPFEVRRYLPSLSPANVLNNLQVSYLFREIQEYDNLLAEDFRFYFSDEARRQNPDLPEYWTKAEDVAHTSAVFESPLVTDVRVFLQFRNPEPVNEPGREGWQRIDVVDTFLEIDLAPKTGEPEGLTLRVDEQEQEFFFRRGRTLQDADSTLYLVEWRDLGTLRTGQGGPGGLVRAATWSSIKMLQP